MNPYYATHIRKEKTFGNDIVIVPLCNGSHFYGYIVDKKLKRIVNRSIIEDAQATRQEETQHR